MERQYPPEFKRPPEDEEDWIDAYAPKDEAENAYFHGRAPEPRTPRPGAVRQPRKKRRWLWVVPLLVVIGAGAWLVLGSHKTAAPAKPSTTAQVKTGSDKPEVATLSRHHDSTNFNLSISYPSDWTVDDAPEHLRVIAPSAQLKTNQGKTVSGHAVVTIQPKQASLPDFAKGPAVAVWQSKLLIYKSPTQNQRAQTYLSSLSYANSPNGSFDAYYLTGDNGYQASQEVPMSDVIQTDPLVTVMFDQCADATCKTGVTPLSLSAAGWTQQNAALDAEIQSVLTSLSIN